MTDVIDTRDLPAPDRYDAAYETIAANLARVDMAFPGRTGLVLRGTLTHLGEVGHSSVDSNVTEVRRTGDESRDLLPPSIFLGLQRSGSTMINQGGRSALLQAGRLVIPFAQPRLKSRSYCAYVPADKAADETIALFCAWLQEEGRISGPTLQ